MAVSSKAVHANMMLFHCSHMAQCSCKSEQRTKCQVGSEVEAGAISAAVLHQKLCNAVTANDVVLPMNNISFCVHPQSLMLHITSVAMSHPKGHCRSCSIN